METPSTRDALPRIPPAATPLSPPVSKPRDTAVARSIGDDGCEPVHPRRRAASPGAPRAHHGRRRVMVAAGGVVTLAALVVGVHYYVAARSHAATAAAVAGRRVHVAPQVAGRVLQVLVTDNQAVQAGDLLVQLDPTDFLLKLNQSLAAANEAHSLLAQARWQVLAAEAAQALAEVDVVTARAPGRGTAAKRTAAWRRTVAQLKATAAAAQVNLARARVATAEAGVAVAEGALAQAGLELAETEVRAPRSGRVRTTNVEPGEYAQVGTELLVLVSEDRRGPANFKADQLAPRRLAVLLEERAGRNGG